MTEAKTGEELNNAVWKWIIRQVTQLGNVYDKPVIFFPPYPLDGENWNSGIGQVMLSLERFVQLYAPVFEVNPNPTPYELIKHMEGIYRGDYGKKLRLTDGEIEETIERQKYMLTYLGYKPNQ